MFFRQLVELGGLFGGLYEDERVVTCETGSLDTEKDADFTSEECLEVYELDFDDFMVEDPLLDTLTFDTCEESRGAGVSKDTSEKDDEKERSVFTAMSLPFILSDDRELFKIFTSSYSWSRRSKTFCTSSAQVQEEDVFVPVDKGVLVHVVNDVSVPVPVKDKEVQDFEEPGDKTFNFTGLEDKSLLSDTTLQSATVSFKITLASSSID